MTGTNMNLTGTVVWHNYHLIERERDVLFPQNMKYNG